MATEPSEPSEPSALIGVQLNFGGTRNAMLKKGKNKIDQTSMWAFGGGSPNAEDPSRMRHLGVVYPDSSDDQQKYHGSVWTKVDELERNFWRRDTKEEDKKANRHKKYYPSIEKARFASLSNAAADKFGSNVWVWQFLPDPNWCHVLYDGGKWPAGWTEADQAAALATPFRYGTLRVGLMYATTVGGKTSGGRQTSKDIVNNWLQRRIKQNHSYAVYNPPLPDKGKGISASLDNRRNIEVVVVYEFDFTNNDDNRKELSLHTIPSPINLRSLVANWAPGWAPIWERLQALEASIPGHIRFFHAPLQFRQGNKKDVRLRGIPLKDGTPNSRDFIVHTELHHEMSDWVPMSIYPDNLTGPLRGIHELYDHNVNGNGPAGGAANPQTNWPMAAITFQLLVQLTPHRFRVKALENMRNSPGASGTYQKLMIYLTGSSSAAAAAAASDAMDGVITEGGDLLQGLLPRLEGPRLEGEGDEDEDAYDYDYLISEFSDDLVGVQNAAKDAEEKEKVAEEKERVAVGDVMDYLLDEVEKDAPHVHSARQETADQVLSQQEEAETPSDHSGIAGQNKVRGHKRKRVDVARSPASSMVFHLRTPVTHRFPPGYDRPIDVLLTVPIRGDGSITSINKIVENVFNEDGGFGDRGRLSPTGVGDLDPGQDTPLAISYTEVCVTDRDYTVIPVDTSTETPRAAFGDNTLIFVWLSWHVVSDSSAPPHIKHKWSMPYDTYYKLYEQKQADVNALHDFTGEASKHYLCAIHKECFETEGETKEEADKKKEAAVKWWYNNVELRHPQHDHDNYRTPVKSYRDRGKRQLLESHVAWKEREDENRENRRNNIYNESVGAGVYEPERSCGRSNPTANGRPNAGTELTEYYKLFDLTRSQNGYPDSMGPDEPHWNTGSGHSDKVSYVAWNMLLPSILNKPQFKVYSMVNAFKRIPDDIEMLFGRLFFKKTKTPKTKYQCGNVNAPQQSGDANKYMNMMASKIAAECSEPYEQNAYNLTSNRKLSAQYIFGFLAPAIFSDDIVHRDTLHTFDIIAECKPGGRIMGYIACTESDMLENSVSIHAVGANDLRADKSNGGFSPMFNFRESTTDLSRHMIDPSNMVGRLFPQIFSTVLFKVAFDRAIWAGYANMDLEALHFSKQSRAFAQLMVRRTRFPMVTDPFEESSFVDFSLMNPSRHIVHSECSTGSYVVGQKTEYLPYNFIGIGLGRTWKEELDNNRVGTNFGDDWNELSKKRIPTITLVKNYWLKGFNLYDSEGQIKISEKNRFYATLCEQTEDVEKVDSYFKAKISDVNEIWNGSNVDDSLPNWYYQFPVGFVDRRGFSPNVQEDEITNIPCAPISGNGRGLYECLIREENAYKHWGGPPTNPPSIEPHWARGESQNYLNTIPSKEEFRKSAVAAVAGDEDDCDEDDFEIPLRDNRFYCTCHQVPTVPTGGVIAPDAMKKMLKEKAESHYGTWLQRGDLSQSTILNYTYHPNDEGHSVFGGERGHAVSDGEFGFWKKERYESDVTKKIVAYACRREALFCAMQPLNMWGERQIKGGYQMLRYREPECSWMSFPHINDPAKNPWLGLRAHFRTGETAETQDVPNPRISDAFVRSPAFNNLYETSSVSGKQHKELFGGDVVGLRWFQYSLQNNVGSDGFKIIRTNYEVIACTPMFNSTIGISAGASGFVVAMQQAERWDQFTEDDLFRKGAKGLAYRSEKQTSFACKTKTVLFGDLTGEMNMSLAIPDVISPTVDAMVGMPGMPWMSHHQSLEAKTWRLRPRRFPDQYTEHGVGIYSPGDNYSGAMYATTQQRVRQDGEYGNRLSETVMQSSANYEKLKNDHTIYIETLSVKQMTGSGRRKTHFFLTPVFKEHFREIDNVYENYRRGPDPKATYEITGHAVGLRFIRDYKNVCDKLKTTGVQHFGRGNGVMIQRDLNWLSELHYTKGHRALTLDDRKEFLTRLLGMPFFALPGPKGSRVWVVGDGQL